MDAPSGSTAAAGPGAGPPPEPIYFGAALRRLGAAFVGAISPRTLVAPLLGGLLLWLYSHSIWTTIFTAALMFVITVGMRAADRPLKPLWVLVARIPRPARVAIAIGVPVLLSFLLLGPAASGKEISRARWMLVLTTVISYVFLRPRDQRPAQR